MQETDDDGRNPAGHPPATGAAPAPPGHEAVTTIDVARVWAGHPVDFALLTTNDRQYVAYFDADRRMTVAARPLSQTQWDYRGLPSVQAGPPAGCGRSSRRFPE